MKLSRFKHTIRPGERVLYESLTQGGLRNAFRTFLRWHWRQGRLGSQVWREHTYIISRSGHPTFRLLRLAMVLFVCFAFLLSIMSLYVLFSLQARPVTRQLWDFTIAENYVFDDERVIVASGRALTRPIIHTDDGAEDFDRGSHTGTDYKGAEGVLTLTTDGMLAGEGTFVSRLMDASAAGARWESLGLKLNRPVGIRLPAEQGSDAGFDEGAVSMKYNTTLLYFDEPENDGTDQYFADSSGTGNTAKGVGVVAKPGGVVGNRAEFDGNNDYLKIFPYKNLALDRFTIAFWVKTSSSSQTIMSYASESDTSDIVLYDASDLMLIISGKKLRTGVAFNDGQWHHLAVSWDSHTGKIEVYRDGFPAYSGFLQQGVILGQNGSLVLGERQQELGGWFDPVQTFKGDLDEFTVFNDVLQLIEVNDIFRRGAHDVFVQVRTCDDTLCSDRAFRGPAGPDTWYRPRHVESGRYSLPQLDLSGRYFQYRLKFVTRDAGLSASVSEVIISPDHFAADRPVVTTRFGVPFEKLDSFSAKGQMTLQLSSDGSIWYYVKDGQWQPALNDRNVSTPDEVAGSISTLSSDGGTLYVRAFIEGSLNAQAGIDEIEVRFDRNKAETLIPGYPDADTDARVYTTGYTVRLVYAFLLGISLSALIWFALWRYHFTAVIPPFVIHDHAVQPDHQHPLVGRPQHRSYLVASLLREDTFMILTAVLIGLILAGTGEMLLQLII
ncbi:MAG: Pentaxin family protein [candidate division WS6 bacterium OLB20]|uniref:Pentaxin family protein n=1 Tax=candidate division WS6 bacterium OLB20 TaxID=1617426 RepID=A0A136LYN9_9BACT|nr:MAG: Pentaxin family protein [candidate division WS6 bacterium OLB20]